MSSQHETRGEGRAVDAAPGDTATEIASGKRGIPVLVAPFQRRDGATAIDNSRAFQGFLVLHEDDKDDPLAQQKKWLKEMRGWLMVLVTVAVSLTYQAGLNPPGGFWQQDDQQGHIAGDSVMRDQHWLRYLAFYYLNATAFVTSVVIMVLVSSERFYRTEAKMRALMLITLVNLASLVGAYVAGTSRYESSGIYLVVIVCISSAAVIYIGEFICFYGVLGHPLPEVPADVVTKAMSEEEAEERSRARKRPCCCQCWGPSTTCDRRDVEGQ